MLAQGFLALLSHWRRKPLQLAMFVLGLALATALWSAVQAINGEARASYARAAAVLGQDRLSFLAREDGARFNEEIVETLRSAGWRVSPVVEGERRFGDVRLRIIGVDPASLPPESGQIDVSFIDPDYETFIVPPLVLIMAPETARRLQGNDLPLVRESATLPPGVALGEIGAVQSLLGAEGQVSRLLLWPEQPADAAPLSRVAPDLVLKQPAAASDLARLTDSFHLNLTAFGFLAFAVGIFIVHAAIGLAFEQRRPIFRTLRALGLPLHTLMLLLTLELLAFAALAGFMGVVLGYGVASLLLPDVSATLRGLYGAEVLGTLSVRPWVWAAGVAIAVGGTALSASGGLLRLWHMPVLAPARPREWARASAKVIRMQAVGSVVLFVLAAILTIYGASLVAGFAALAALLLGAALALPPLLSLLLAFGGRLSRGVLAQWFWADTRQQLPGLSLALMALLLALAANIGVGSMVSSFRLTFTGWLDQRLASELYVTARTAAEGQAMRDWLIPRSDAVLPVWNSAGQVSGQPVLIYGMADHATYRDNWPMLSAAPGVWDEVAAGRAVIVNEQLSRRTHLSLGDRVQLARGPSLPVAGVFSDYGNPRGEVIISIDLLTKLYPDAQRLRFAVRVAPAKAAALADQLRAAFDLPVANVVDQASVKAFSLRVFERTFAVTATLNVLTLGVAAIAIFASLLTLAGMRLPQIAPVWAMGFTRRNLALLELLRSLALAALTMLLAIPVGLGLAWLLLAVVNVEAFGWRLPLHVFPWEWLRLGLLALLAAGLAALIPALRLVRLPPAELLKVFASER